MNGLTLIQRMSGSYLLIGPTVHDKREILTIEEVEAQIHKYSASTLIIRHPKSAGVSVEATK
jgi:hypothetical protein